MSYQPLGRALLFLGVCFCSMLLEAAESAEAPAGHPLLSGMPGFVVAKKEVKAFDALKIQDFEVKGEIKGSKFPLGFEGKITTVRYEDMSQRGSNIAVYRNYDNALRELGATRLNTGFEETSDGVRLGNFVYRVPAKSGGDPTFVLLYINSPQWYSLTFVEPAAMEQSVKAGQLADEIKSKGFASLYINFDTNKSALPPDGQVAVKEIAALLKSDPSLKLSIEGHTDNVGQAAANKKLSDDRARSVQAAVVALGIDPKRLTAKGFGSEVPVADNRSEDGRAKNRRVELVKKS